MAKYSSGHASPAAAANAALSTLWTPAARSARVLGIEVLLTAATATDIALKRITARGTQTTTVVGQALDSLSGASTVQNDQVWSVQPTFATGIIKRQLVNVQGSGFVWVWDDTDPLVIGAAAGLSLQNVGAGAGGVCSVNWLWDES